MQAGGAAAATIQSLDPSASPLDHYGWELRRQREAHGLRQGQLGDIIFCTGSLIGRIETTKKVPTRDFSERVDAALGTDGAFSRLVGLVLRTNSPTGSSRTRRWDEILAFLTDCLLPSER